MDNPLPHCPPLPRKHQGYAPGSDEEKQVHNPASSKKEGRHKMGGRHVRTYRSESKTERPLPQERRDRDRSPLNTPRVPRATRSREKMPQENSATSRPHISTSSQKTIYKDRADVIAQESLKLAHTGDYLKAYMYFFSEHGKLCAAAGVSDWVSYKEAPDFLSKEYRNLNCIFNYLRDKNIVDHRNFLDLDMTELARLQRGKATTDNDAIFDFILLIYSKQQVPEGESDFFEDGINVLHKAREKLYIPNSMHYRWINCWMELCECWSKASPAAEPESVNLSAFSRIKRALREIKDFMNPIQNAGEYKLAHKKAMTVIFKEVLKARINLDEPSNLIVIIVCSSYLISDRSCDTFTRYIANGVFHPADLLLFGARSSIHARSPKTHFTTILNLSHWHIPLDNPPQCVLDTHRNIHKSVIANNALPYYDWAPNLGYISLKNMGSIYEYLRKGRAGIAYQFMKRWFDDPDTATNSLMKGTDKEANKQLLRILELWTRKKRDEAFLDKEEVALFCKKYYSSRYRMHYERLKIFSDHEYSPARDLLDVLKEGKFNTVFENVAMAAFQEERNRNKELMIHHKMKVLTEDYEKLKDVITEELSNKHFSYLGERLEQFKKKHYPTLSLDPKDPSLTPRTVKIIDSCNKSIHIFTKLVNFYKTMIVDKGLSNIEEILSIDPRHLPGAIYFAHYYLSNPECHPHTNYLPICEASLHLLSTVRKQGLPPVYNKPWTQAYKACIESGMRLQNPQFLPPVPDLYNEHMAKIRALALDGEIPYELDYLQKVIPQFVTRLWNNKFSEAGLLCILCLTQEFHEQLIAPLSHEGTSNAIQAYRNDFFEFLFKPCSLLLFKTDSLSDIDSLVYRLRKLSNLCVPPDIISPYLLPLLQQVIAKYIDTESRKYELNLVPVKLRKSFSECGLVCHQSFLSALEHMNQGRYEQANDAMTDISSSPDLLPEECQVVLYTQIICTLKSLDKDNAEFLFNNAGEPLNIYLTANWKCLCTVFPKSEACKFNPPSLTGRGFVSDAIASESQRRLQLHWDEIILPFQRNIPEENMEAILLKENKELKSANSDLQEQVRIATANEKIWRMQFEKRQDQIRQRKEEMQNRHESDQLQIQQYFAEVRILTVKCQQLEENISELQYALQATKQHSQSAPLLSSVIISGTAGEIQEEIMQEEIEIPPHSEFEYLPETSPIPFTDEIYTPNFLVPLDDLMPLEEEGSRSGDEQAMDTGSHLSQTDTQ